jgi:2-iminoacetate synthase
MSMEANQLEGMHEVKNRIDHMKYLPDMEVLEDSSIMDQVLAHAEAYDYHRCTEQDVHRALQRDILTPEDFAALFSPAAEPFLEEIARKAQEETRRHFGNAVSIFTPLYVANYCENYCIYCGFNRYNHIRRARLTVAEAEKEMQAIAATGLEEILILTGESRKMSDPVYIGEICKAARKYFKMVGLEVIL